MIKPLGRLQDYINFLLFFPVIIMIKRSKTHLIKFERFNHIKLQKRKVLVYIQYWIEKY